MNKRKFLADNPVLKAAQLNELSPARIEEIVGQYVGLVTMITSYLFMGSHMLSKIPAARDELVRNIGEERGSLTGGYTHHEILNRELMKLGVKANLTVWDAGTRDILAALGLFVGGGSQSEYFVAGVIYALEATATPELQVVGRILNEYARMRGLPQLITDEALVGRHVVRAASASEMDLSDFFGIHIEAFEPGHRDRFAQAIASEPKVEWSDRVQFATGFRSVLTLMELWWERLALPAGTDVATIS
ncbi:MAG: hypothetical protein A2848_00335 [Candidatus Magasanikbacteria bacterium RIFCSPHIGHO2_01_FULL_50_8]|uniref:Thiaminase-2/PQQC domain-containing protein n=1 Tax=Candidatus Magasanikbacteria bacterium RIFCSPHIGHO2_01_FULL_50_8 TaxID=1798674 RepID=A0A1F6LRQ4_9BACT|nr:MAG: hypothetical protein A2848_00335 [Candidatus Magasanikbacteria bacterium RIFCSPHIGHO2_01_FULL_50_8]